MATREGEDELILSLDEILKTLGDDLVTRGVTSAEALAKMDRLDLSVLLLDTYVKYPLPSRDYAFFPYNYCVLPRLFDGMLGGAVSDVVKTVLSPVCA